jgi:hypothetical protein
MSGVDAITIVRACGRRLAKLVRGDGTVEDYDQAKTVDLAERRISGIEELGVLLARLQPRTDLAVVRGAIADAGRARRVRRLFHPDPKTSERPTLIEVPRRWVAFDFDAIDRPATLDVTDLEVCGEIAVALLPPPFRYAAAVVQATASHGVKAGIRLRLWHWLDRPVTGAELKYWFRNVPVDASTFRTAQLIFTANPVFTAGASDPLPARQAWRPGSPAVRVSPARELQPPPRSAPSCAAAPPAPGRAGSGDYAATMLTQALVRIGRAGVGQRNPTLFAAACGLAPLIKQRLLDEDTVTAALTGAARGAGIDGEPRRDARREAEKALAWALTHLAAGRAS